MEKKKEFIINVLFYSLILGLILLCKKYLLPILLPFVFGFFIAYVSNTITKKLFKNNPYKRARILVTILLYLILIGISTTIISVLLNRTFDFLSTLPTIYKTYISPALNSIEKFIVDLNKNLPFEIETDMNNIIREVLNTIETFINSVSSKILVVGSSLITNTSSLIASTILMIVSSFFFITDYDEIFNYLMNMMSDSVKNTYLAIIDYIQNNLMKILKSYGVIMGLTFVELLIGFLIAGYKNAVLMALLIALLDILPVLGVGTVLIPWSIIDFVLGNIGGGLFIICLYLIITIIRNMVEPKMVGGELGLHPLVTLSSMLVGVNIFGIIGLFGLPLTISFILNMKKNKESS